MPPIDVSTFGDFASSPIRDISFCRIAQPSTRVPPPFRFALGPVPKGVLEMYFTSQGLSSAGVYVARDMSLTAEFLLMRGNTVFRCPEMNIHPAHIDEAMSRRGPIDSSNSRRALPGQYAFLAGPGHRIYGHWLVDHLPRLAVLHEAGFDIFKLRYLLPSDTPAFAFGWLGLLGIKSNQLVLYDPHSEILMPEEVLLPTILHNGSRVSSIFASVARLFKRWIERNNISLKGGGGPRHLFVSRRYASQSRRLVNRERIEELAQKGGFAIVHPEQLPILDQARLFAGAEVIVGEYGSALHGSIFSEPGTVVCGLRGSLRHPGFIQSGLGHALEQPTGYVFGETDATDPAESFILEPESFEVCLNRILQRTPLNE